MIDEHSILITGGEGMIGRVWPEGLKPSQTQLDVCNQEQIEAYVQAKRPSAIVHLAALDIYQAETNPSLAINTNVLGTYHLAQAAAKSRIPFVFISSGAVFNGGPNDIHNEGSRPQPVNVFGYTKYISELLLQDIAEDILIIRTGWVFGGNQAHHRKFVDLVLEKARRDEPIEAVSDRWGSPTYVVDLVQEVSRLLQTGQRGLVHVINKGKASAYDMAKVIITSLQSRSELQEKKQADFAQTGPKRAVSEAMHSRVTSLRSWQEALKEYVTQISKADRLN